MSMHHDMPAVAADVEQLPNADTLPDARRNLALLLLCVAQFMLVLDVTVLNVALPQLAADIGLDGRGAAWAIAAYAIPFGGFLLLGGRLADLFGSRRMVLLGLSLFTAASLAAGFASSSATLLAARAGQGLGAALLSPAALSTIVQLFTGPRRNRALAVWAAVGGSGAAVGVLLGGLLVGGPGWRWIFFINVPVGVLVALTLPLVVPVLRSGLRGRVDVVGAALATLGMAALVAAIGTDIAPGLAWAAGAVGALSLAAFVVVERRTAEPLVALEVFTRRPLLAGVVLMLVATGLLVGGFFLLSFLLQAGMGWSPTSTGLAFLPIALGAIAGAHVAGSTLNRVSGQVVAPVALLTAAAGFAVAAANPTSVAVLIAAITVVAIGAGAGLVTATTTALATAGEADSGVLSGVVNTFHELGAAVGAAVFSGIAAASLVVAGPSDGYVRAFTAAAVIAVVGAVAGHVLVPAGRTAATGQRVGFH